MTKPIAGDPIYRNRYARRIGSSWRVDETYLCIRGIALRLRRLENPKWKYVEVRSCRYLNNILEQDHRAIKRRCESMTGFKSFATTSITIASMELAHRIHKRQFTFGPGSRRRGDSRKQQWARALA